MMARLLVRRQGNSIGFFEILATTPTWLNRDQVDGKAIANLRGVVRTSHKILSGRCYQSLDSFAPAGDWEVLSCASIDDAGGLDRRRESDDL
jgi:hypothetical protein